MSAFSQRLPFKSYTTADGLGHNRVNRIYQDKKGFLWFATAEGLNRFDGYEFTTFGVREGLPNLIINDVSEDRQGRFWVAANDFGIALLNDKNVNGASKIFTSFSVDKKIHGANKVDRLLIDSKDNLWCLTDDGIYRAPVSDNPEFTLVKAYPSPVVSESSMALFEDNRGNVWFGIHNELFEMRGDEIINHGFINADANNFVINALQTKDGRIIILSRENGLYEFFPETSKWQKLHGETKKFRNFRALIEDNEGSLWFGGDEGFAKLINGKLTEFSSEPGFEGNRVLSLFQDREGNLWSGNRSAGVFKLSDMSISAYPLAPGEISLGIVENNGRLRNFFCKTNTSPSWSCLPDVRNLSDERFGIAEEFSGILQTSAVINFSKRGESWIVSSNSGGFPIAKKTFFHFRDGNKIDLKEFFDKPFKDSDDITVYLDEQDFLWVSKTDGSIYRTKFSEDGIRNTEKFAWNHQSPALMIGDGENGLWLFRRGARGGRLRNGKYESFDSLPEKFSDAEGFEYLKTIPTQVSIVFFDSRRWLWAGSYYEGLFVCKNPNDEKPVFEKYTTENGLLSDSVWAISEDNDGRMYFGTGRGLNRFDTQRNIWNSFKNKIGLTGDRVSALYKDSRGNIWINTRSELTKFNPQMESKSSESPPIYITHIKIAGKELPISEMAITENVPVSLASSQNNLTIDFVGLQFKSENNLIYQYKLEGSGEDWIDANKNRSITLANLSAGSYRFYVRAINEDGLASVQPAVFQFKILPPFYLRWWFVALMILVVAAIIYSFYRLRLQKLLEIERTRTLIATDLHDDIGSNLSKISVLSEVARMQSEQRGKSDNEILSSIAEISRHSVSSMRDIVWAINPNRDSVQEMIRKMREYAEEILVPKDVEVKFKEPDQSSKIKLPMDLRRDLYLIFKEAVNNIAKHSDCTKVKINLEVQHHEIILRIEDNGIGFDLEAESSGNGLINMKKRAERLKGDLQIESQPNLETKVIVRFSQN